MIQDPPSPAFTPRNWALLKTRLFGFFLALLGGYFVYAGVEYWLLVKRTPAAEYSILLQSFEMLAALALLLFGLGMLAHRRWAWFVATLTIAFVLAWWTALGLGWIFISEVSDLMPLIMVGVVLPAALGFLGFRFLFATPIRDCCGVSSMRVRGWLAGAILAGALVPLVLNAAGLAE